MKRGALALLSMGALAAQQPHEMLNAALWAQTAVEHHASALQAYRQARAMLDRALKDKKWTAAVEQTGKFRKLPPAVIVDVDETVIDNSPYQARRVLANDEYEPRSWSEWVKEASGTALPGAVEFLQYARSRGVRIFYITNRVSDLEEATIRNLKGLGLPADEDAVMCIGEIPAWTSDKSSRRSAVAERHRILLLVGDDFGDFLSGARQPSEKRNATAAPYRENWGIKWIILPNPMYGSWEGALHGFERIPRAEKLERKWKALNPKLP